MYCSYIRGVSEKKIPYPPPAKKCTPNPKWHVFLFDIIQRSFTFFANLPCSRPGRILLRFPTVPLSRSTWSFPRPENGSRWWKHRAGATLLLTDLAPHDSFLFLKLKGVIKGSRFPDVEAIRSILPSTKGIDQLLRHAITRNSRLQPQLTEGNLLSHHTRS